MFMLDSILKALTPLETETLKASEMICRFGTAPEGTAATHGVCHVDGVCDPDV